MNLDGDEAVEQLVEVLKSLRLRRGLQSQGSALELKPALLSALRIDRSKALQVQRSHFMHKMAQAIQRVSKTVPESGQLCRNALNLDNRTDAWLDRAQALADREKVSRRTVIRRTDAALLLLASDMLAHAEEQNGVPAEKVALKRLKEILDRREEIRIEKFDVTVRVYTDRVEVYESVQIISQSESAQFYVIGKTLPYKSSQVTTTVLEGALLREIEQPNEHWLLELLELPTPLPNGTPHRFTVIHEARGMAPMWTATSMHEADELRVTVWYADRQRRPIWLVDEFPPKLLNADDIKPILEKHAVELEVDRFASASHTFKTLKPNRSYGLGWTTPLQDSGADA